MSAGDPASGFVQPDAKDSARDLTAALSGKKSMRLVTDRAQADVWVRVDKRFRRGTGSAIASGSGTTVGAAQVEDQVVSATLIVGDYTAELEGADWWSWKSAAGKLAKTIDKWIKENNEQIVSRRKSGQ